MPSGSTRRGATTNRLPWSPPWKPRLERQLSSVIMHGAADPKIQRIKEGKVLTEQGAEDSYVFLLLDGVLVVEVDGVEVAEVGPGSVVGERAVFEGGTRTSTLRGSHAMSCRCSARVCH